MWSFPALCDDFSVTTRLFLKLNLDASRETVLHFFDRVRRAYPRLTRLRRRDEGGLVLTGDEDADHVRRWVRLDAAALKFGQTSPPGRAQVQQFGELILSQAPPHLSLSELDYDYMDVVFEFGLEYRGNHDELVADTLFPGHKLVKALTADGARIMDCQPLFGLALSEDCDSQAYVEIKGRTTTYELRSGEYEASQLGVVLTLRRYWGFGSPPPAADVYRELLGLGESWAEERVVPNIVQPLAAAIGNTR